MDDSKADYLNEAQLTRTDSNSIEGPVISARPPIEYHSVSAFFSSTGRRFKSIWTKRFALSLLAGQIVSLCITCTNVTYDLSLFYGTGLYRRHNLYSLYTPYTIYKYGFVGWAKMILRDGWRYLILAACDVEGNFMVVKAYQYTDLLSCMLLDAWAIPVCLFFSWLFMRTKYHWTQILGVLICVGGLGMLVASDMLTQKNWQPTARGKGDAFMVAWCNIIRLYLTSQPTPPKSFSFVKGPFTNKVVGCLGMFGFIICGAQAGGLEHAGMLTATWDGATIGLLIAYTAAMFILYTVAPLLYRMASSAYYNLSLLSSDFYGLLFGLFLFHYSPYWLYFIAFAIVLVGLIVYFWSSTPEEQGEVNPQAPKYLRPEEPASSSV
ncbi:solute carrier family 35 member SLC35F1/F2/F6 [Mycena floridula]|nr:solute carrier family 35 member SLC35F1/F2/F6 [Mycena floridula]